MVELARAGRTPEELWREFEPSAQSISNWVAQGDRDTGKRKDRLTTVERAGLADEHGMRVARKRVVRMGIFRWREGWYNPHLHHSALG